MARTEIAGEAYERLLGVFGLRAEIARLRLGAEEIELIDFLAPEGRSVPEDSRSDDEWFQNVAIIVRDMDAAYAHLRRHKVRHASSGPQRLPDWNPNAGGIEAFYFKDPDGHHLEILAFPPDKGAARWHAPGAALFLGIDHTAIVVRDTLPSLAFFEDALGLEVRGRSENYGTEQEHLNNVFGARLLITALGAAGGPAVEFLDYLTPATGRATPIDSRANDLWNWHVTMMTGDLVGARNPAAPGRRELRLARHRRDAGRCPRSRPGADGAQPERPRDPSGSTRALSAVAARAGRSGARASTTARTPGRSTAGAGPRPVTAPSTATRGKRDDDVNRGRAADSSRAAC